MFTDEDICEVDLYVKSRLVTDTIKLAKKDRSEHDEIGEFGCLSKIHPPDSLQGSVDIYDLVRDLRQLFYNLTPIKNKASITSQVFEKLYNRPLLRNANLQKIDLGLSFQQAAGGAAGQRQLDFIGFCQLMRCFYEAKMVKQAGYAKPFPDFVKACLK